MSRFLFTIAQMHRYCCVLKQFRKDQQWHAKTVLDIDSKQLQQKGIQALILDFDGVLAAHGEPEPRSDVLRWLDQAEKTFKHQIFILSNKPNQVREDFFKQHYPDIQFIKDVRKKPYPDGLLHIQKSAQVDFEAMVLVDDRLLTGVLAALSVNAKAIWIRKPYANFKKRFRSECFFAFLRWLEAKLIW